MLRFIMSNAVWTLVVFLAVPVALHMGLQPSHANDFQIGMTVGIVAAFAHVIVRNLFDLVGDR